jgi:hypothetical protein
MKSWKKFTPNSKILMDSCTSSIQRSQLLDNFLVKKITLTFLTKNLKLRIVSLISLKNILETNELFKS